MILCHCQTCEFFKKKFVIKLQQRASKYLTQYLLNDF